ncbi:MAG: thermonuclease family protein [Pseudomonadota bacterium]
MRDLIIILTTLSISMSAPSGAAMAQEVQVFDGETLSLDGSVYRLYGVDAPEMDQYCIFRNRLFPCGQIAKDALTDMISESQIRCRAVRDLYTVQSEQVDNDEAVVARCTANGYDLSKGMADTGWAMAHPKTGQRYRAIQLNAREAERGLWRGDFVMPWEWRQGRRLPQESGTDLTN